MNFKYRIEGILESENEKGSFYKNFIIFGKRYISLISISCNEDEIEVNIREEKIIDGFISSVLIKNDKVFVLSLDNYLFAFNLEDLSVDYKIIENLGPDYIFKMDGTINIDSLNNKSYKHKIKISNKSLGTTSLKLSDYQIPDFLKENDNSEKILNIPTILIGTSSGHLFINNFQLNIKLDGCVYDFNIQNSININEKSKGIVACESREFFVFDLKDSFLKNRGKHTICKGSTSKNSYVEISNLFNTPMKGIEHYNIDWKSRRMKSNYLSIKSEKIFYSIDEKGSVYFFPYNKKVEMTSKINNLYITDFYKKLGGNINENEENEIIIACENGFYRMNITERAKIFIEPKGLAKDAELCKKSYTSGIINLNNRFTLFFSLENSFIQDSNNQENIKVDIKGIIGGYENFIFSKKIVHQISFDDFKGDPKIEENNEIDKYKIIKTINKYKFRETITNIIFFNKKLYVCCKESIHCIFLEKLSPGIECNKPYEFIRRKNMQNIILHKSEIFFIYFVGKNLVLQNFKGKKVEIEIGFIPKSMSFFSKSIEKNFESKYNKREEIDIKYYDQDFGWVKIPNIVGEEYYKKILSLDDYIIKNDLCEISNEKKVMTISSLKNLPTDSKIFNIILLNSNENYLHMLKNEILLFENNKVAFRDECDGIIVDSCINKINLGEKGEQIILHVALENKKIFSYVIILNGNDNIFLKVQTLKTNFRAIKIVPTNIGISVIFCNGSIIRYKYSNFLENYKKGSKVLLSEVDTIYKSYEKPPSSVYFFQDIKYKNNISEEYNKSNLYEHVICTTTGDLIANNNFIKIHNKSITKIIRANDSFYTISDDHTISCIFLPTISRKTHSCEKEELVFFSVPVAVSQILDIISIPSSYLKKLNTNIFLKNQLDILNSYEEEKEFIAVISRSNKIQILSPDLKIIIVRNYNIKNPEKIIFMNGIYVYGDGMEFII